MIKAKLIHDKNNGERPWGFVFTKNKRIQNKKATIKSTTFFSNEEMVEMKKIFEAIDKF